MVNKIKILSIIFFLVLPLIMAPFELSAHGLFVSAIMLWMLELIPLPITALLIPVGASWLQLLTPSTAFAQFGNQILFLFLGSFLLAQALEKHHLDKRIAYWLLSKPYISRSPEYTILVLALLSWVLSMWISNTATTAMMIPLCLGISRSLSPTWSELDKKNLEKRLLFASAFAASIGGMATPVGSPPNLLAMEFLNQKGFSISFFQWMTWGVPLSFVMLIVLIALLKWKFPIKATQTKGIYQSYSKQLHDLGRMSRTEIFIVLTFLGTVLLWILPDLLQLLSIKNQISSRLPMGAVALLGAAMLFILPHEEKTILDWEDSKAIDWGTILIFGGGLCLGKILDSSGLASQIGTALFSPNLSHLSIGIICIFLGIIVSEFSSNTAATTLLVPIIIAQFGSTNAIIALTVATAFGASFGFMLPVSTPPNAIIFGTGKIPLREMIKTGSMFDILGGVLVALFLLGIYPLLGTI